MELLNETQIRGEQPEQGGGASEPPAAEEGPTKGPRADPPGEHFNVSGKIF